MNSFLDWIVVILPFAGFVYLAIYPPKRFRWEVIAFGVAILILTFVQQDRSRKAHEVELQVTNARLDQTSQDLEKLPPLLEKYMSARNTDEAKILGDTVKQVLQQAQKATRPNPPFNVTVTAY